MTTLDFNATNIQATDTLLDNLSQHGFSIVDDVYLPEYTHQLREECLHHLHQFRQAAIQNGIAKHIRSDHILWIDPTLPLAQQHIHALQDLSDQLNRAFFLGIQDVEAHFACYNAEEFYALHRDNPHGKNGRVISAVYYVHESWQPNDGGQLRLQDKNGLWHTIDPEPNRLALFQSDLLHEVLPTQQQRLSITAWLRKDSHVLV